MMVAVPTEIKKDDLRVSVISFSVEALAAKDHRRVVLSGQGPAKPSRRVVAGAPCHRSRESRGDLGKTGSCPQG